MTMTEELRYLCDIPGVSGDEDRVADYIMKEIRPYCDQLYRDALGNVIALKKGAKATAKPLMFCAHMDEVGLIITARKDDGTYRFAPVGGIDPAVLPGKSVRLSAREGVGTVVTPPVHLTGKEQREKPYDWEDLALDFPGAEAACGDTVVFEGELKTMGSYLCGKAIDDRFGCYVLLEMIHSDLPVDCVFVFTVQEEIGCRGAAVAAFSVQPEIAVVVETTTAADLPGVSDGKQVCRTGDGPVISFMDKGTIYDRNLYELCRKAADDLGIPNQTKTVIAGGNDAQRIQIAGAGVRTVAVSLACRYLHSPSCMAHVEDMNQMKHLCRELVGVLGKEL